MYIYIHTQKRLLIGKYDPTDSKHTMSTHGMVYHWKCNNFISSIQLLFGPKGWSNVYGLWSRWYHQNGEISNPKFTIQYGYPFSLEIHIMVASAFYIDISSHGRIYIYYCSMYVWICEMIFILSISFNLVWYSKPAKW